MGEIKTIDERVVENGLRMVVQNIGRHRIKDGMYTDLWSCTLAFPDDDSDLFWLNTGQTVRVMSGVIWGGSVAVGDEAVHPDIEAVLQMLCQDAVNVENTDGRLDAYMCDYMDVGGEIRKEDVERRGAEYRTMQRNTDKLRDFLCAKFDTYLRETEWTR